MVYLVIFLFSLLTLGGVILLRRNAKSLLCLLMAAVFVITLAGCGKDDAPDTEDSQPDKIVSSNPNSSEDPDGTEASQNPDGNEDIPLDTDWIVADWCSYYRYDNDGISSLFLMDLYLSKYSNGVLANMEVIAWETETGYLTDTSGTHDYDDYFTYTFDGKCLSITYDENDGNRQESYTVNRSEDGQSVTLNSTDGEGALAGIMFIPADQGVSYTLEELVDIFDIDCGLFQPENPQKPDRPDDTEPPTEPAPDEDVPADNSWIVGEWTTVERDDSFDNGSATMVTSVTYGFGANGFGSINEYGWIGRPGTGWEIAGRGFVETYFAYTLEGDTLTITHTGNEFEEYPEAERETRVYTVVRNQDGSITWKPAYGKESKVFRHVRYDLTVEELLNIFGLDTNIPGGTESPSDNAWIVGTWRTISRYEYEEASHLFQYSITFNADGTGSISDLEWVAWKMDMGEPNNEWQIAGRGYITTYITYTVEGENLYITFTADAMEDFEDFTSVFAQNHTEDGTMMALYDKSGNMGEGGIGGRTYVHEDPDDPMSLEELCMMLCVDYRVPQIS